MHFKGPFRYLLSPVASARANPRIAYVNNCPRSAGFRAVDEIRDENTDPIPIPAPVNPIAANPAPMYFAACNMFLKIFYCRNYYAMTLKIFLIDKFTIILYSFN